jgi:hypothetical protein
VARANGHAKNTTSVNAMQPDALPLPATGGTSSPTVEKTKELFTALEVPFDSSAIKWRVVNTSKINGKLRGQVMPYADQRAYTDRLNSLVSPAGWTRKYAVHTSANFERGKDKKTTAKVFVTCELTIYGLGSHSATGEEFAENDNAGSAAEAQAFKRASSCFGLGRYLYYFTGVWVDLNERKQPNAVPQLAGWATPEGWLQGLRPKPDAAVESSDNVVDQDAAGSKPKGQEKNALVQQIESMARPLGRALYRGILKSVGSVWNPDQIHNSGVEQRVLEHMRAAERGLGRLQSALERVGVEHLAGILDTLRISSLERVDNLATLKKIVTALEAVSMES